MKPLKKDICITLIFKIILTFALWYVCFNEIKAIPITTQQWLFGRTIQTKIDANIKIDPNNMRPT